MAPYSFPEQYAYPPRLNKSAVILRSIWPIDMRKDLVTWEKLERIKEIREMKEDTWKSVDFNLKQQMIDKKWLISKAKEITRILTAEQKDEWKWNCLNINLLNQRDKIIR